MKIKIVSMASVRCRGCKPQCDFVQYTWEEMETVEDINQQRTTELGLVKSKTEDEFLVKIGAKEEFDEWDPKVTEERLRRSRSFICPEYHQPACYRRKPKTVLSDAWSCNSQACRQLFMQQRLGPKSFYINNPKIHNVEKFYLEFPKTQSLGLCCYPQAVDSL